MEGSSLDLIKIKDVSYQYPMNDEYSLKNIDLNISKGKIYGVIGNNGSGKTSLCNLIRGFIPHFYNGELSGDVTFREKDIREWDLGELSPKIGYIFQNPFTQISSVKDTVFDEIAFGLENLGLNVEKINETVKNIMKRFNIEYLRNKNPLHLSGGQKQRVALASVIAMKPEVLVIDEPTSQLDPHGTEEVFKIINHMKKEGSTIILVEHKIEYIAEYADDILVLQDGEIIMQGETREILTSEKALSYNVEIPQFTLLGHKMKQDNLNIEHLPLTEKEASEIVSKWLLSRGRFGA